MSKDNNKQFIVIRSAETGRLEKLNVKDKKVFDGYRRGEWAEKRNERKQRRLGVSFTDILPDGDPDTMLHELADEHEYITDISERHELMAAVRLAVNALPPRQRQVIELLFFEGFSTNEAARLLGLNHSTVSRQRDAALKRLRELLRTYFE